MREEAALQRRRALEAQRLQKLKEANRKKTEKQQKLEEERKALMAVREEQRENLSRRLEEQRKEQAKIAEAKAKQLAERLKEHEARRKEHLELIQERAAMGKATASVPSSPSTDRRSEPESRTNFGATQTDGEAPGQDHT